MLRGGGIAETEELGKLTHRAFALDEPAQDQQPMAIRE